MKIKLSGTFKSLSQLESDDLGDFTVIIGKNGTGKTHFVELLTKGYYEHLNSSEYTLEISALAEGPSQGELEFSDVISHDIERWKMPIKNYLNKISNFSWEDKTLIQHLSQKDFKPEELNEDLIKVLLKDIPDGEKLLHAIDKQRLIPSFPKAPEPSGISNFVNLYKRYADTIQLMKLVSTFWRKPIQELNDVDYYHSPIPEILLANTNFLYTPIGGIFYLYAKRRDLNIYHQFRKKEYGEKNDSISHQEFVKNNPPPWEIMNKIFDEHNIEFQFQGVDIKEFYSDIPINFNLVNTKVEKAIDFQGLSSGEKIIIGLITKVFLSEYLREKGKYQRFLVLDEPDAHLHPEMSSLLIDVLQKTFVQKLRMKIIITTHSPSTVALCPEGSIYEMQNGKKSKLFKITKDHALNLLTGSLPTLSIDYQNHKQVFVESDADRYYYQIIYDKLHQAENYSFKLYFIPYGNTKGGSCDQVKDIVSKLREAGNKNCFGIIDWDLKNSSANHVIVHGEGYRYTLENYLFDPVYLSILFLNNNNMHKIDKELKFEDHFDPSDLKHEANERLQEIWNWFLKKLSDKFKGQNGDNLQSVPIKYLNGKEVHVPQWYVKAQGHLLEEKYKEVFSALKQKFGNNGKLKEELSKIAAKAYPLIPLDTKEVFEKIKSQR